MKQFGLYSELAFLIWAFDNHGQDADGMFSDCASIAKADDRIDDSDAGG